MRSSSPASSPGVAESSRSSTTTSRPARPPSRTGSTSSRSRTQLKSSPPLPATVVFGSSPARTCRRLCRGSKADGRSHRTANQHRMTCIAFATWCVERKLIGDNPFNAVSKLKEEKDRRLVRRAGRPEELQRLFQNGTGAPGNRLHGLRLTGLRRSEMRQLRWSDIDFSEGTICVRAEVSKTSMAATIPLNWSLAALLAQRRPKQPALDDLVFETIPRSKTFYRDLESAAARSSTLPARSSTFTPSAARSARSSRRRT